MIRFLKEYLTERKAMRNCLLRVFLLAVSPLFFFIGVSSAQDLSNPYETLLGRWEWNSEHCSSGPVVLTIDTLNLVNDGSAVVTGTYQCDNVPQTHKGVAKIDKQGVISVKLVLSEHGSTLKLKLRTKNKNPGLNGSGWFRNHSMDIQFHRVPRLEELN